MYDGTPVYVPLCFGEGGDTIYVYIATEVNLFGAVYEKKKKKRREEKSKNVISRICSSSFTCCAFQSSKVV